MRLLSLSLLIACGEKDDTGSTSGDDTGSSATDDTGAPSMPDINQGVIGEVTLDGSHCSAPPSVDIWSALPKGSTCDWSPEFDTGWADEGHWSDNVGDLVDTPKLSGAIFGSELDVGDYEVRYIDECYGCVGFSVADGAVTNVTVELRDTIYADAPNIYLYPTEPTGVSVTLAEARHIVAAEPDYPVDGWHALATPSGLLLTEEGEADYLFYELRTPSGRLQREAGWCVEGHLAQASIEEAMALSGFLDNEIVDFSDFWDAHWPAAEWMTVYPQTRRLGGLRIHPEPDALLRLWFVVEDGCAPVEAPTLPEVVREGFHASEWGVVFDRQYSRTWDLVQ